MAQLFSLGGIHITQQTTKETMKKIVSILFVGLFAAGCSTPRQYTLESSLVWESSPVKLHEVFNQIQNPYRDDEFASFAFAFGYISAYALGPDSVGTHYFVPMLFTEKKAEEAYRAGWQAGAMRAFEDDRVHGSHPQ